MFFEWKCDTRRTVVMELSSNGCVSAFCRAQNNRSRCFYHQKTVINSYMPGVVAVFMSFAKTIGSDAFGIKKLLIVNVPRTVAVSLSLQNTKQ